MRNLLNCKEATTMRALGDLSQMTWSERFFVRFHTAICWVCRKYERQIKVIGHSLAESIENERRRTDISKIRERLVKRLVGS